MGNIKKRCDKCGLYFNKLRRYKDDKLCYMCFRRSVKVFVEGYAFTSVGHPFNSHLEINDSSFKPLKTEKTQKTSKTPNKNIKRRAIFFGSPFKFILNKLKGVKNERRNQELC